MYFIHVTHISFDIPVITNCHNFLKKRGKEKASFIPPHLTYLVRREQSWEHGREASQHKYWMRPNLPPLRTAAAEGWAVHL